MQGSIVEQARVLERGFENDRRYMLVDESGTFISQRTHPQLVFFRPKIVKNELIIKYKNDELSISLDNSTEQKIETKIFEHAVPATVVSDVANSWFSMCLGQDVKLVKMLQEDVRHKKLVKGPEKVEVSFADGYPYLIVGEASLKSLNNQLDQPVPISRFRGNIILETDQPHVEDSWEAIEIGAASFFIVKPCARCQVITIDQDTGVRGTEPLKTLSTYRKQENKVYFGANAISRADSIIRIGDEVVVL